MSLLTIHPENQPEHCELIREPDAIAGALSAIGVSFERWAAERELSADADPGTILEAYREPVERLKAAHGFQSADVISVGPDHPQKSELRAKFLNEHTHSDFEVRFFVAGQGLFYLHPDERVFVVLCERGDLISVPSNVRHWFDMGQHPQLQCIRLFTTPEGWVAEFTGDPIASRFPTLDEYRARYP
jgi:1,2-dihydroxy-3-keto-5-methylthiopentene dioxygenase